MTKEQAKLELESCKGEYITFLTRYGLTTPLFRNSIILGDSGFETPYGFLRDYASALRIFDGKKYALDYSCTLGSDPEFFLMRDGKIVPSTEALPESGEVHSDGVQGELNPESSTCRQTAAYYIYHALDRARTLAKQVGATLNLDAGHVVSEDVWKTIPASVRRFGCNPTENAHEKRFKRVTGLRERFRAAGGHIHVSLGSNLKGKEASIVQLMDLIVGNTCVLIDRDPINARRRVNYGRAGEYRVKPYGIEYRVLSNFWLKHYTLWSMASGLVRNTLALYKAGYSNKLLKLVNIDEVREAINKNNYELSLKNFLIYKKFLEDNAIYYRGGIDCNNSDKFLRWATGTDPLKQVGAKGVSTAIRSYEQRGVGFENFLLDD